MAPAITQNKMGEYPVRKTVPAITPMQGVPAVTSMQPAPAVTSTGITTTRPVSMPPVTMASKGEPAPGDGYFQPDYPGPNYGGRGGGGGGDLTDNPKETETVDDKYKVNFKDFGPQWQSLENKFGQAEAVSGKSMPSDMKAAYVEEALNVGSTKAVEAVNLARQQRQKEAEMQIQRDMLQIQRDLLNKEQDGGGGTVICTELHRQHLISDKLYFLDALYGRLCVEPDVMAAYQIIAAPFVRWMQQSRVVTFLVKCVVSPVMRTMASRMSSDFKPSVMGSVLLGVGIWCCKLYDTGRIIFGAKGKLSCKG